MTEHDILVGPGVVASVLRVHPKTAKRRMERGDFGEVHFTPGGHRRVRLAAVQAAVQRKSEVAA
jgi:hypothetical protein